MLALASSSLDDKESILYCYSRNRCDSVRFGLITISGGAAEIADLYGLRGKAGPTLMINPDRTIDDSLSYNKFLIRKYFPEYGIEKAECSDSLEEPAVGFLKPLRNEAVPSKESYEVQWRARDVNGISASALYFSSDNGTTWEFLDSSANDDSTYTWKTPDVNSEVCRLKLHVYDTKQNMKEKISIYFTIDGTSGIINKMDRSQQLIKSRVIHGSTSIYAPFSDNGKVSIINTKGKTVSEFRTSAEKQWYPIGNNIGPGVYILCINRSGKNITGRLILIK